MEKGIIQQTQMNTKDKITAFFHKNYAFIFAPLIVLCVYTAMLIRYGVYPFGAYTVASYDLSAQIVPFFEHIFDVFNGKSTLFYTHALVGGMDVTGSLLYFILSPFSVLFFIFGEGRVAHAASLVMACKLMAVCFAGTWFVKKVFKTIPDYLCMALGLTYTYCGYMFVSNTYINWVDLLIYMPFATAAFRYFVQTDKFLPFAILLACCIYTCFSIACFSMFTVFPLLIAYALLCVEKQRRKVFITKLCLAFVVAVLLALPVLLPSLAVYLRAARGDEGGIFANIWNGFTNNGVDQITFDKEGYQKLFSEGIYRKWSYILSDAIFVLLTLVWFYRSDFKKPFVRFMLLAGVFTLLPTVIDEAMLLMNMGSYMSYALRFGFLNAMFFFGGACLCLDGVCFEKQRAFDGTPLFSPLDEEDDLEEENLSVEKGNDVGMYALNNEKDEKSYQKKYRIWSSLIIALGVLAFTFLIVFMVDDNYKDSTLWGLIIKNENNLNSLMNFSGSFAHSLGGMPIVVVFFVTVTIVALIGFWCVEYKKISPKLLSYVLVAVVGLQVIFYNGQLVLGNLSDQQITLDSYSRLCAQLNENDDSYFRVKDYNDTTTLNASFRANSNAFSVFSSMTDKDNFATHQLFGYLGNGQNTFKSAHNKDKNYRCEEFGDSFLGYKYYLVLQSEVENILENTKLSAYVKPYMVPTNAGGEEQLHDGEYYVFVNEIVFPSAYVLPSGAFRFTSPNEANSTYRKYNQKALYEFLRGETLVNMQSVTGSNYNDRVTVETARELSEYLCSKSADIQVTAGKITATVSGAKAGEALFLNFVASKGYTVTVNGKKAELIDNDLKFLSVALEEGDNEVVFEYKTPYVKYMAVGAGVALIVLLAVAFVMKTKIVEWASPVVAWAGIGLATALVAFFMLYPTVVALIKLIHFF